MGNVETPKRRNAETDCGLWIVDCRLPLAESQLAFAPALWIKSGPASWPCASVASRFFYATFRRFGVSAFWRFTSTLPLLICALTGCASRPRAFQPPQSPALMEDAAFLHYLATVPVVNVDEGMRAVLLLKGPSSNWPVYDDRRAELLQMGAFQIHWKLEADDALDKGTLAYMLRVLCRLPRSFTELASLPTGVLDRRYALKTCVYEEILPYSTAREPVTGGELLSALTKAEGRMTP